MLTPHTRLRGWGAGEAWEGGGREGNACCLQLAKQPSPPPLPWCVRAGSSPAPPPWYSPQWRSNVFSTSSRVCARRLVSSIASLVGVGVFNYFLRDVPPRKMFAWTSVLGTGLGMTQLMLITGGGWGGGWGGGEGGLSVRVWLVRGGRDPDVPPPDPP